MALLEVKNLQVRVEDREILHSLSLTVNKGEVHAIMGPNGSGKSTLSHVIAGKPGYEVTAGEILFEGEDLLRIEATVRVFGRTGVEMEALTAVSVAALTVYDMCKAVDRVMTIERVRLEEKSGGRSGLFRRDD